MAKLLSDPANAVRGKLVAIDNSGLLGPLITLRVPPTTYDIQRPGSYIDLTLLDTARKTLQKRVHVEDELEVIVHAATTGVERGTRNELTFQIVPKNRTQRVSHTRRRFDSLSPINGKVTDNDGHHVIAIDAGVPMVVSLLQHKPSQTQKIKLNSWIMFWPTPPTHGIILGRV